MDVRPLIRRKRDGEELEAGETAALVGGLVSGDVDPEQVAAWLMAGVIRGFSEDEAVALTAALVASGRTLALDLPVPTVDKHSTGGVGDSATLVVAPLLAACGVAVVKLSGRALGHTGGTIDKLESIPGMRVDLEPAELVAQARGVGIAVGAASSEIAPADKVLYALRDATETVDDVALVAASVMSKKIAGGAGHVVLDVKTGAGAFFPDPTDARALAELCARIGAQHGRRVAALVTDMSQPLGPAVGNALEVTAAVDVLAGRADGRLGALSRMLAARGLVLTGATPDEAGARVDRAWRSGAGLDAFRRWIAAQGGDPAVADAPGDVLPRAPVVRSVTAERAGHVTAIGCRTLGEVVGALGAARHRRGDDVDPRVGVVLDVAVGDEIAAGDRIARVHAADDAAADEAAVRVRALVAVEEGPVDPPDLVLAEIG